MRRHGASGSHKVKCDQTCPQPVTPEIAKFSLPLQGLGTSPGRGKTVTYFFFPNAGQLVAFSDLKLTHTAAVFVPLSPGCASGIAGFVKWSLLWESFPKRLFWQPQPTSLPTSMWALRLLQPWPMCSPGESGFALVSAREAVWEKSRWKWDLNLGLL